ncbi:MAG: PEGA domain-containing protein [Methanocalculus sp.]|uniref:PEGA domain-containing protein n=1 Tax=Methanocalculus sp. TaxID=2004547 RepID=UPI0027269A73|nr:PEGA domain-containing protein [Methanocalculus sp.]MDO9538390.1 PEGA domain-containing protein [Methanocalculus sp.]
MRLRSLFLILIGLISLTLCTIPAAAEQTGSITISSSPEAAEVYITNVFKGYTPVTIYDLRPGMTRVTLKKPNYQNWDGVVYVIPQQTVTLNPVMVRTGTPFKTYGSLVVTSSPGASVTQNGNYVGITDAEGSFIIAQTDLGVHLITIEKEGYLPFTGTVEITSGKTSGLTADLMPVGAVSPGTVHTVAPLPTAPEKSAGSPAVLFCSLVLASVLFGLRRRF